jgi:hypothetical protein
MQNELIDILKDATLPKKLIVTFPQSDDAHPFSGVGTRVQVQFEKDGKQITLTIPRTTKIQMDVPVDNVVDLEVSFFVVDDSGDVAKLLEYNIRSFIACIYQRSLIAHIATFSGPKEITDQTIVEDEDTSADAAAEAESAGSEARETEADVG